MLIKQDCTTSSSSGPNTQKVASIVTVKNQMNNKYDILQSQYSREYYMNNE